MSAPPLSSLCHAGLKSALTRDENAAEMLRDVVAGIAKNVKVKSDGYIATSGVMLPYYLNLATNFMDPALAPKIVKLIAASLLYLRQELAPVEGERIAVIGMEVAGGMIVAQLAASADAELRKTFDFVYMRKARKSTGTAQQLEGKTEYTARDATSAPCRAVWVDDVVSTGSSLVEAMRTLEDQYNIDCVAALFVVDRSSDRQGLPQERQKLAAPRFVDGRTRLYAIIDIVEIDPLVTTKR
jgi:orotate phosphoribosyltransferase